jgi:hypothetical protein
MSQCSRKIIFFAQKNGQNLAIWIQITAVYAGKNNDNIGFREVRLFVAENW